MVSKRAQAYQYQDHALLPYFGACEAVTGLKPWRFGARLLLQNGKNRRLQGIRKLAKTVSFLTGKQALTLHPGAVFPVARCDRRLRFAMAQSSQPDRVRGGAPTLVLLLRARARLDLVPRGRTRARAHPCGRGCAGRLRASRYRGRTYAPTWNFARVLEALPVHGRLGAWPHKSTVYGCMACWCMGLRLHGK